MNAGPTVPKALQAAAYDLPTSIFVSGHTTPSMLFATGQTIGSLCRSQSIGAIDNFSNTSPGLLHTTASRYFTIASEFASSRTQHPSAFSQRKGYLNVRYWARQQLFHPMR
ncbi:hypothetical protein ABVK25_011632 [Lepraria finkii]|uniref:Uncharacterized protein n=1 Tax=Lepraria finkii TaxID=1340010 RepID=A0ABR4AMG7_9LECA